ncbi:hypothetical protein PINS_up000185 [Pythium insidiosum]|nr:hypothetical protein PINS_up000185 [Pythium insidiosum]
MDVPEDPKDRLAAFHAKMFDMPSDAAPAVKTPGPDDVVKVQWKPRSSARLRKAGGNGGIEDDDDAMPVMARVVKAAVRKPPTPTTVVSSAAVTASPKRKKKKNKRTVHQLVVPAAPSLPTTTTAVAPTTAPATTAVAANAKMAVVSAKPAAVSTRKTRSATAAQAVAPSVAASAAATSETTEQETTSVPPEQQQIPTSANKSTDAIDDTNEQPAAPSAPTAPSSRKSKKRSHKLKKSKAATEAVIDNDKSDPLCGGDSTAPEPAKEAQPSVEDASRAILPTKRTSPSSKSSVRQSSPIVKPATPTGVGADSDDENATQWDINSLMASTMQALHKSKTSKRKAPETASDSESEQSDDGEDGHNGADSASLREYRTEIFSQLIDEAAREEWELVEVGRLVRLFAAQWSHKKKKTARFLRRQCPELVSVDFMEGLNINMSPKQLLKIFDRGSGTPVIFMNKVASAVENGHMSIGDDALLACMARKTMQLATNAEVAEFLMPLLESLSKVKDVGVLLRHICQGWHLDRTIALVQELLLTAVFDDLDGRQEDILEEMPELRGRLDFPSRMDDEDADEDGNLKGLIAKEDSDLGEESGGSEDEAEEALGEILSDDAEAEDSHAEDEVYEGETDSEEEAIARSSPSQKRRRSRFILDEADEGESDEESDGDGEMDDFLTDDGEDDGEDSSSDSEDEDTDPMPRRKRPSSRLNMVTRSNLSAI